MAKTKKYRQFSEYFGPFTLREREWCGPRGFTNRLPRKVGRNLLALVGDEECTTKEAVDILGFDRGTFVRWDLDGDIPEGEIMDGTILDWTQSLEWIDQFNEGVYADTADDEVLDEREESEHEEEDEAEPPTASISAVRFRSVEGIVDRKRHWMRSATPENGYLQEVGLPKNMAKLEGQILRLNGADPSIYRIGVLKMAERGIVPLCHFLEQLEELEKTGFTTARVKSAVRELASNGELRLTQQQQEILSTRLQHPLKTGALRVLTAALS